ncbi:MAG: lysophospholipid acyltransferase family protein, partial [Cyclobacteriaceae bacterium]
MIPRLLSRLPFPVLYLLSDFLYLIAYYVLRYRRDIVYQNIKRSFPEKSEPEIRTISKQFYRNLADIVVETLKSLTIKPEVFKKRFVFTNPELAESYFEKDQSVLAMAGHLGNWEWLLLGCCIYLSRPIGVIYKKLSSQYYDQLMVDIRSRFGGRPILMEHALMDIARKNKEVTGYGIVSDQVPLQDGEKHWTTFLNQDTAFFVGTAKIARLTSYPVLFLSMKKVKRGHYTGTFKLLAEAPYEKDDYTVLEKYAHAMEECIRENPSSWLW